MTIRRVIFFPYAYRQGPIFTLSIIDSETRDDREYIHYRLRMKPWIGKSQIIFEGTDFGCSSLHAINSDETVKALMGFLTLRLGDTDSEYFADYTPDQLDFSIRHAEVLSAEVDRKFWGIEA
jgi:hypothetical protein